MRKIKRWLKLWPFHRMKLNPIVDYPYIDWVLYGKYYIRVVRGEWRKHAMTVWEILDMKERQERLKKSAQLDYIR